MSSDFKKDLSGSEPDAAAVERVWRGVRDAEERRRPTRWLVLAAVLVVGALALTLQFAPWRTPVQVTTPSVQLAEGAQVELGPGAQLEPVGLHALALHRGSAHFSLEKGPWVVSSKRLRLEVASATFQFDVADAEDSVTVTRGEVRLAASGFEAITLREGQSFSTASSTTWETLARAGDLAGAWKVLGAEGVRAAAVRVTPEHAMLLSDVAAAGRDEALSRELLTRVMGAEDAGAERGLAAYTLGQRLEGDGAREAAAKAYRRSLELGLPTELRDDALQRASGLER